MDEDLIKSLLKRAKGYRYNEVQEEYSVKEDGDFVLTKRKSSRNIVRPIRAHSKRISISQPTRMCRV